MAADCVPDDPIRRHGPGAPHLGERPTHRQRSPQPRCFCREGAGPGPCGQRPTTPSSGDEPPNTPLFLQRRGWAKPLRPKAYRLMHRSRNLRDFSTASQTALAHPRRRFALAESTGKSLRGRSLSCPRPRTPAVWCKAPHAASPCAPPSLRGLA